MSDSEEESPRTLLDVLRAELPGAHPAIDGCKLHVGDVVMYLGSDDRRVPVVVRSVENTYAEYPVQVVFWDPEGHVDTDWASLDQLSLTTDEEVREICAMPAPVGPEGKWVEIDMGIVPAPPSASFVDPEFLPAEVKKALAESARHTVLSKVPPRGTFEEFFMSVGRHPNGGRLPVPKDTRTEVQRRADQAEADAASRACRAEFERREGERVVMRGVD